MSKTAPIRLVLRPPEDPEALARRVAQVHVAHLLRTLEADPRPVGEKLAELDALMADLPADP